MSDAIILRVQHTNEEGNIAFTITFDGAEDGGRVEPQPWMLAALETGIDGLKRTRKRIERALLQRQVKDDFETRKTQLRLIREGQAATQKALKEAEEIQAIQGES